MLSEKDWSVELPKMLQRQDPEDSHLDYKERRSLLPPSKAGPGKVDKEKRAKDISKDVSSFLNYAGGALVYGIREDKTPQSTGGAPIPINAFDPSIDGYSRGDITKEDIENIITSSIEPRIGADLFRVNEVEIQRRIIFIVEVAEGTETAYQAKDLKYYKRFNFKAEPMEHHEIEMIRNRAVSPKLEVVAGLNEKWGRDLKLSGTEMAASALDIKIHLGLRNSGKVMAEVALLELGLFEGADSTAPAGMLYAQERNIHFEIQAPYRYAGLKVDDPMHWFHLPWNPSALGSSYQPLFTALEPTYAIQFVLNISPPYRPGILKYWCWRIQAPGMPPVEGLMALTYIEPLWLVVTPLDWEFEVDILK